MTMRTDKSKKGYVDEAFGGCPRCGRTKGYMNIGRAHWLFCDRHMLKWCVGNNLFSTWRDETEEDWRRNWEKLQGYSVFEGTSPRWLRIAWFLRRHRYRFRWRYIRFQLAEWRPFKLLGHCAGKDAPLRDIPF